MKNRSSQAGFSLVEVMMALLVLGVAIVGLTQGLTTALHSTKESEWQTTAAFLAAGQIELLRADGFLKPGVSEGKGSAQLASYEWTETVSSTEVAGLFEVSVEVRREAETSSLYELRTLLFDPPFSTPTNRPSLRRESALAPARRRLLP